MMAHRGLHHGIWSLWVLVTRNVTVYAIQPGRGSTQAAAILGSRYGGIVVRDRWAPYRKLPQATRRTRPVLRTSSAGLTRCGRSPSGGRLVSQTERSALFTCGRPLKVEATNWQAAQAIRPTVVTRKSLRRQPHAARRGHAADGRQCRPHLPPTAARSRRAPRGAAAEPATGRRGPATAGPRPTLRMQRRRALSEYAWRSSRTRRVVAGGGQGEHRGHGIEEDEARALAPPLDYLAATSRNEADARRRGVRRDG